ncbi:hypothetical protein VaNZ11_008265 [Volvox africanus]|uniref:Uncharacterized protein n=1 Tax=Volvox africanus TaxID=51714 RepID=A0ABQ5S4Q5_9CHLO|nr:hypothetical protein VaNZ11_008265 [Volvox africanus]
MTAQSFRHRATTFLRTELAKNNKGSDEIPCCVVAYWYNNRINAVTGRKPLPANGGMQNADAVGRPKTRSPGVRHTSGSCKLPKLHVSYALGALATYLSTQIAPKPLIGAPGLPWLLASAYSLRCLHGAADGNAPMASTGLPSASSVTVNENAIAQQDITDIKGEPNLTTHLKKRKNLEIFEQIQDCTDAEDLLDLLASAVGVSKPAVSVAVHSGPPSVPDRAVVEILLRLSTLPRSQPPPVSEEVQARLRQRRQRREDGDAVPRPPPPAADPATPGSDEWWQRRRALVVGLFRQLVPLYGTMDLTTRVALLESCSHLTWLLGYCQELKPARHGDDNDVSAAAGDDRRHPAQALLDAVLNQGRGLKLVMAASAQLSPSCDTDHVGNPAQPSASLAARVLASMGRLRYQSGEALANLLPPLMARRRNLKAADLVCVVTAVAELRPIADQYVSWSDVCDGLAAPGALRQLTAAELVRLAQALADVGAIWSDGGKGRDRDPDSDVESSSPSYTEEDLDEIVEYNISRRRRHGHGHGWGGARPGDREHDMMYGAVAERTGEWTGADAEERLLTSLGREVSERAQLGGDLSGGQVVQLMVATAKMGLRDTNVLKPLAAAARRHLPSLRPDEVSQLMCATARMGFVDPALIDAVSYTVSAVQSTNPVSYNVRSLAIVCWALACHGRPCPDLFSESTAIALINGMRIRPHMSSTPSPPNLPPSPHLMGVLLQPPHPLPEPRISARPAEGSDGMHEEEASAALPHPKQQQQLQLRPYEVANSLWAFARQNTRHRGLMRAAVQRCADWQRRGRLPRSNLIKVIWAATKMGYVPRANGGADSGSGWRRSREEVVTGLGGGWEHDDDVHSDALLLAERVAELVIGQGQRFTGPDLVHAAEALEPYCTAGGPMHDKYGRQVYQRLMEVAQDRVASLRPDACVALLSTLSRATVASEGSDVGPTSAPASPPPLSSLNSRLLLRAQQRLMGPLESGKLSIEQLLQVMEVLRRADARNSPSLPGMEQQLLRLVAQADAGDGEGAVVAAMARPLRGDQAMAALMTLGSLQRHGAAAELFRLTHRQVTLSLEQQSPEGITRLLRVLGAAVLRDRRQTAAAVAAMTPAPTATVRKVRNRFSRSAGRQQQPESVREEPQAALAAAVLGSGLAAFLSASWRSLGRPGELERLSTSQLVDAVWGLAACGYDDPRGYDELVCRLRGRVKNLPAWSLARIAAAMHGHCLNNHPTAVATSATVNAISGARSSLGGTVPQTGGSGGVRPPSHLERHPELAERIAKYGTRELTRLGSGAKPQDLATLVEVFASAAPQYSGLFLAAAHRARRWLKEAAELEEETEARSGGATDRDEGGGGGGGQTGDLREAATRVRAACEAAGYDVSEVLGRVSEPARSGGSSDGAERGNRRGVSASSRFGKVYGGAPVPVLPEGRESLRGLLSPWGYRGESGAHWAPGSGNSGRERAWRRREDDRRIQDLPW